VDPRLCAKRAALDQKAFAIGDCVFDEGGVGQIPMNGCEIFEAEFFDPVSAIA
jgi:hypothetical protein